jgi:hypothetical protein
MSGPLLQSISLHLARAAMLALAIFGITAQATASAAPAAPLFPTGSLIGLVPPPGMTPSKSFPGFVDPEKNAGIIIATLPVGAYADMEKTLTDDALKQRGITLQKRQSLQLSIGKGELVIGTQLAPNKVVYRKWLLLVPTAELTVAITVQAPERDPAYSDAVVGAALASLAIRPKVPDTEFLTMLPFTIGDLAGFHIGNIIPGRALLLLDAPKNPHLVATGALPEFEFNARFIITALPPAPSDPQQRAIFARDAFGTIAGIKDTQVTMAEPVRLDSEEGFETVASAKDADSGANLMVIQWLIFGGGGALQMIGISRADLWDAELSRMRTMRDSIALK